MNLTKINVSLLILITAVPFRPAFAAEPVVIPTTVSPATARPVATAPAPSTPQFGTYSGLAGLVRNERNQDSENQRIPGNMIRSFGIETESTAVDVRRIYIRSEDRNVLRVATLVTVPESRNPYLVLLHGVRDREGNMQTTIFLIDHSGALLSARRRPNNDVAFAALGNDTASDALKEQTKAWEAYQKRVLATAVASNSESGQK